MRVPAAFLALAAATALAPASAHGSTVFMEEPPLSGVFYESAPGEANRLTATFDDVRHGGVTLHDDGAVIQALSRCQSIDDHTAYCPPPPVPDGFEGVPHAVTLDAVHLGDGDDVLTTVTQPDYDGPVTAYGGRGDDVLSGAVGADWLDGGPGADHVSGGDGRDFLSDGDRTGDSPQPDVLDGGGDDPFAPDDTISYEHRRAGVKVDLVHGVGGEPGEGDTLSGFESAVGGAGDDRLIDGSPEGGRFSGNNGDDTLIGGRGYNTLMGGDGDDILAAGPDINEMTGGRGLDTHRCSTGQDQIDLPSAGEFLSDLCDELNFNMGEFHSFHFPPLPVRTTHRAVWFGTHGCPSYTEGGDFQPCSAVMRIRGGRGNRLLGRRVYEEREPASPVPPYGPSDVRVPLTRAGRRLAARGRGVVATVSFNDGTTKVAWTIRLSTRR
jgi:hypothetical protein